MTCPYCQEEALLMNGEDLWGEKGVGRLVYVCLKCDSRVGSHPDGTPLGTMADKKLRELRRSCHRGFDILWGNHHRGRRGSAYRLLYSRTGVEHIGSTDVADCGRVLEWILSDEFLRFLKATEDPSASLGEMIRKDARAVVRLLMMNPDCATVAYEGTSKRIRTYFDLGPRGAYWPDPFGDFERVSPQELIWRWVKPDSELRPKGMTSGESLLLLSA